MISSERSKLKTERFDRKRRDQGSKLNRVIKSLLCLNKMNLNHLIDNFAKADFNEAPIMGF